MPIITTYQPRPGEHCGSTAMRNPLQHYCDLDLSEEMVFGLGSGPDCLLLELPRNKPPWLLMGRSVTMETDIGKSLQVDYRETPQPDDAEAWRVVRAEVDGGRPTMLSGDVFYLDYRDFKVHFPSHRFVLVGYDDDAQKAILSDRLQREFDRCSYSALAASRNPPNGLSTFNLWGKFHDTGVGRSLEDAVRTAIRTTARRMTGTDSSQMTLLKMFSGGRAPTLKTGLDALGALADVIGSWSHREDGRGIATYAAASIEKYGSGGSMFRQLYVGFLNEAAALTNDSAVEACVPLATASAKRWTKLATQLDAAGDGCEGSWSAAQQAADQVFDAERTLAAKLGEVT